MADGVAQQKRALRAELRERRRIMPGAERAAADAAITEHLVELTLRLGSRSVAAYLSRADEPGTRDFVAWARAREIRVLLPVSRPDRVLDWASYDGVGNDTDMTGMPIPTSELLGPDAIDSVDLIIAPAAAIDRTGMRMGWGLGYYDKTLGSMKASPPVYAVIFDHELVDTVPSERHDHSIEGVVTPSGITTF